jgi:hypothetical protein
VYLVTPFLADYVKVGAVALRLFNSRYNARNFRKLSRRSMASPHDERMVTSESGVLSNNGTFASSTFLGGKSFANYTAFTGISDRDDI